MSDDFVRFYKSLDSSTFKVFVKGEWYSVFDDDIRHVTGHGHGDVVRKGGMDELRISKGEAEEVMKSLLTRKSGGMAVQEYSGYELVREGYPGNWHDFADMLLDSKQTPSVAAVKIAECVEISFVGSCESTMYTCIFKDDDVFSGLYGILNEENIVEVVCDTTRAEELLNRYGIPSHLRKCNGNTTRMLCEYLRVDEQRYEHREYVRRFVCRVDKNALFALNVLNEDEHCVFSTFSCITNQGHRHLQKMFLQPLTDRDAIEKRLDVVEALMQVDLKGLKGFPDLQKHIGRIWNGRISFKEMLRLIEAIRCVPGIVKVLGSSACLRETFAATLDAACKHFDLFLDEANKMIDVYSEEECGYTIRPGFSDKLGELRKLLDEVDREIYTEYERVYRVYPHARYDASTGMFRSTRGEYQRSQDVFKKEGFLELSLTKGGVSFTTRMLSCMNEKKAHIKAGIDREEEVVLGKLRMMIKKYLPDVECINHLVAHIDVLNAFSIKASVAGYSRPVFSDRVFEIRSGFHPVLEDRNCIRNTVSMGEKRMCVVTGPNMGGKSTFIKTCGVIALMAQIGCYIPAEYGVLPIFDGIYVRAGAGDCAFTGASTFMAEMVDIARICHLSTRSSLIIIDELGRGTSAIDGLSIAQAVKEHIVSKGALCFCATHFPELCGEDVVNKRVKSDGTLLMYEVIDGVCDTSFGIMVAEKAGFPSDVVEMAKAYMDI
jgi:DNA mismatch repair protein MSH2